LGQVWLAHPLAIRLSPAAALGPSLFIGDLNGGSKSKLKTREGLRKPARVQGSLLGQHMSFAWTSRFDFNGENMQQVACFGNRKAALGYALCRISESVSSAVRDF
jgi:hypothetical protein